MTAKPVLIVATHVLPAKGYGGVAVVASDLAKALAAKTPVTMVASDASAIGPSVSREEAARIAGCGVYLYRSRLQKKQGFGLAAIPAILRHVMRSSAIYICGVSTMPTTIALIACWALRKPFVLGLHGGFMDVHMAKIREKKPLKARFYRYIVEPLGNKANAIHVMGNAEARESAQYFSKPMLAAPIGVSCKRLVAAPPPETAPQHQTNFLYVGRLSPEKGVLPLLETWRASARPHDTLRVIGSGIGGYADAARKLMALDDRISFAGEQPREKVFEAIKACHFLVLASGMDGAGWENYGLVIAEALALGRPVIVPQGLTWDNVGPASAGFVFPSNGPGLARALQKAAQLSAGEYHRMTNSARRLAEASFDVDRQADRLLAALFQTAEHASMAVSAAAPQGRVT
ncbi:MAG: glycosyltransferase [Pseudomonadota bacterium]